MKMLMTADTIGGVWTYSLELAQALAPHDVQVALATMGRSLSAAQWQEAKNVPGLTVYESQYKLEWMESPWDDIAQAGEWLLGLERELRPDVVHLNGYAHGALAWNAPVLIVAHSCVCSWFQAAWGVNASPEWDRYREEVSRGLQAAHVVAAPTRAMLAALEWNYGPCPQGQIIPNSRAARLFSPLSKEPFILSAGRLWDEAKNISTVAGIAGKLPWPVCVAGDAQGPQGGVAQFANVNLLGTLPTDTMAGWMGRASLYVLPARYEPFGLSALEAGLAGCALVLGDIPSLREVWGNAAVYVSPEDPEALRTTLQMLIDDDAQRQEMAARARERALTYTPERMASEYLKTYHSLLEKSLFRAGATAPVRRTYD